VTIRTRSVRNWRFWHESFGTAIVSILARRTTSIGGPDQSRYVCHRRGPVLEDRAMGGLKHTSRLSGSDPEAVKWAVIAAAVAMTITAGVMRFGPERPVTGADHQRFEQALRGAAQN
jgi:hypothetical protein